KNSSIWLRSEPPACMWPIPNPVSVNGRWLRGFSASCWGGVSVVKSANGPMSCSFRLPRKPVTPSCRDQWLSYKYSMSPPGVATGSSIGAEDQQDELVAPVLGLRERGEDVVVVRPVRVAEAAGLHVGEECSERLSAQEEAP